MLQSSLNPKQARLLHAIAAWPPEDVATQTALSAALGYRAEGAVRHALKPLEENGLVERGSISNGHLKPLRLTEAGRAAIGLEARAQVFAIHNERLENVMPVNPASCGALTATADEPAFFVERLADVFHGFCPGDQLLIAVGDSMVSPDGDSICDGDRCLMRPDIWPADGETVYVEYERGDGIRECTLKDWFCNPHTGRITLRARNPEYSDIERAAEDVIPRGVILEIVRRMRQSARREYSREPDSAGAILRSSKVRSPKKALTKKPSPSQKKATAVKTSSAKLRKGE